MKYHLDSNAWITAFNHTELYSELLSAHSSGALEIEVTRQVHDELTDENKINDKSVIKKNQKLLDPFSKVIELDSIFILGVSRLGEARIAGDDLSSLYSKHLEAKSMNLNNIRDGMHLANADYAEATLVTCDRQIQNSAVNFGIPFMCLGKLCESQNWSYIYSCADCP